MSASDIHDNSPHAASTVDEDESSQSTLFESSSPISDPDRTGPIFAADFAYTGDMADDIPQLAEILSGEKDVHGLVDSAYYAFTDAMAHLIALQPYYPGITDSTNFKKCSANVELLVNDIQRAEGKRTDWSILSNWGFQELSPRWSKDPKATLTYVDKSPAGQVIRDTIEVEQRVPRCCPDADELNHDPLPTTSYGLKPHWPEFPEAEYKDRVFAFAGGRDGTGLNVPYTITFTPDPPASSENWHGTWMPHVSRDAWHVHADGSFDWERVYFSHPNILHKRGPEVTSKFCSSELVSWGSYDIATSPSSVAKVYAADIHCSSRNTTGQVLPLPEHIMYFIKANRNAIHHLPEEAPWFSPRQTSADEQEVAALPVNDEPKQGSFTFRFPAVFQLMGSMFGTRSTSPVLNSTPARSSSRTTCVNSETTQERASSASATCGSSKKRARVDGTNNSTYIREPSSSSATRDSAPPAKRRRVFSSFW